MPSEQQKILIPHPKGDIVGILQTPTSSSKRPERATPQPLALILHGVLAHKDQIYHKRLANALVDDRALPSFRYDLRGQGGETDGYWGMMNLDDDCDDLAVVLKYLTKELGYYVQILIGHSRGSMLSATFLSTRPHDPIPYWVNVSGRYDMTRVLRNKLYQEVLADDKVFDWNVKVAGKEITRKVTKRGVRDFAEWDNSYLITSFPQDTQVLTIHGDADLTVPVEDAYSYAKILSQRSPGTHTLKIVPGAGHNFVRPFEEPVNGIMSWFNEVAPIGDGQKQVPKPKL